MAQVQKLHKYLQSPEAKRKYSRLSLDEIKLVLKEVVTTNWSATRSQTTADLFRKYNFRIVQKKGYFGYKISK